MISTKGRYALRVMIDLAEHANGSYIPMREVAKRQELSLKYLEQILPVLKKAKLIEGVHGAGGGYRLCRAPEDYTAWEILTLTEEGLAPVACLADGAPPCARAAECRTLPLWQGYYRLTEDYFQGITLASLLHTDAADNYII